MRRRVATPTPKRRGRTNGDGYCPQPRGMSLSRIVRGERGDRVGRRAVALAAQGCRSPRPGRRRGSGSLALLGKVGGQGPVSAFHTEGRAALVRGLPTRAAA